MHSRLFFVLAVPLISVVAANASSGTDQPATFTVQVASFPTRALADEFVAHLVRAGEHPSCATVDLQARGSWTREFVGLFATADAARRYGESLVTRRITKEFLVTRVDLNNAATRPRRVIVIETPAPELSSTLAEETAKENALDPINTFDAQPLPVLRAGVRDLALSVDTSCLPRPDPVSLAFKLVGGDSGACPESAEDAAGLWLTGDVDEALSRLRWIVGQEIANLIAVSDNGQVVLDRKGLAEAAGLSEPSAEDALKVANYISSNEGLLLVVQLAYGHHRYCLHIGGEAPTFDKPIEVTGAVNLDNNFDSRINPYRKHGRKLDSERPPDGFDSMVGLNPIAQWYNLSARSMVQAGEISFHELAEAHAKVELGFDYLGLNSRPGAHEVALEREARLKSQRPEAGIVMTAGANRVLRSREEIRLFFAEATGGMNQR